MRNPKARGFISSSWTFFPLLMQISIQINLIPHSRIIWNQIVQQSHIVPIKWSCIMISIWPHDSSVVKQQGTTLRGVGKRAGVCECVFGDSPLHNPKRGIGYAVVCVWMRSLCMKQNYSPIKPAQIHTFYTHRSMSTQTATHSRVSIATPNKQTVHVVTPPQQKEEKPKERRK